MKAQSLVYTTCSHRPWLRTVHNEGPDTGGEHPTLHCRGQEHAECAEQVEEDWQTWVTCEEEMGGMGTETTLGQEKEL